MPTRERVQALVAVVEADGPPVITEEFSLQRWESERIADERFFYDPRQTRPAVGV